MHISIERMAGVVKTESGSAQLLVHKERSRVAYIPPLPLPAESRQKKEVSLPIDSFGLREHVREKKQHCETDILVTCIKYQVAHEQQTIINKHSRDRERECV